MCIRDSQWLSAQDAEKITAVFFAIRYNFVQGHNIKACSLFALCYPATLARKIAVVGYRNKLECREIFATFFTFPEFIEPN